MVIHATYNTCIIKPSLKYNMKKEVSGKITNILQKSFFLTIANSLIQTIISSHLLFYSLQKVFIYNSNRIYSFLELNRCGGVWQPKEAVSPVYSRVTVFCEVSS